MTAPPPSEAPPPPRRPLTPLSNVAIEALVPRLRGRTPIDPSTLLLSVLVPVYNEERTIRVIIEQIRATPIRTEIICVNDCSTDGSREILDRLHEAGHIQVLVHKERNEGKGAAIRTALQRSRGNVVIVQDAAASIKISRFWNNRNPLKALWAASGYGNPRFSSSLIPSSTPYSDKTRYCQGLPALPLRTFS